MDSVSLVRVTEALNAAWGPDTCAPEDIGDWSEENPARGQCATTAVVVHDYFGGDLVRGEVHVRGERVDFHWWNRLPDGSEIDLTREQFSVRESVIGGVYVPRPTGWTRLDYEYSLLSGRVAEHLKRSPTTFLASQG
ncbi:YunG family protein [Rhodococcus erythropolis]|uniref:YunG family protein n=1 Tax=Rhodococcus erythropolis TaxID=1833 RepID=UPI003F4BDD62